MVWLTLGCHAPPPIGDAAADEAAVRVASAAWDTAHNAGDVARLVDLYTDTAASMPFNRSALEGRPAIESDFRTFFSGATAHHRTEIVSIVVSGDWAVERGRYHLAVTPKDTGKTTSETGKHVVIRRRVGDAWKVHWEIWNTDAAPPSP